MKEFENLAGHINSIEENSELGGKKVVNVKLG